jgi:streptomycin 6-kinase
MTDLPIPSNLARSARDESHPLPASWLEQLPETVARLSERWSLRVAAPFEPGGVGSWTAPARDADGRDLVLKVGWPHPESEHEPDALRLWAGGGTVLLHASHQDADAHALLLEHVRPGTELGRTRPEPEQDTIVAGLLRRLWLEPPARHPFRPLAQMCEQWAAEYEESPNAELDPGIARAGLDLFRTLPGSADRTVVLVTDLHAGNVLAAEREPWLVIDPKPYVGDPAYDPLQHLYNCRERLEADPHLLADRMADLCGLDRDRFRLWLFARCVIESSWTAGMTDLTTRLAP